MGGTSHQERGKAVRKKSAGKKQRKRRLVKGGENHMREISWVGREEKEPRAWESGLRGTEKRRAHSYLPRRRGTSSGKGSQSYASLNGRAAVQ